MTHNLTHTGKCLERGRKHWVGSLVFLSSALQFFLILLARHIIRAIELPLVSASFSLISVDVAFTSLTFAETVTMMWISLSPRLCRHSSLF